MPPILPPAGGSSVHDSRHPSKPPQTRVRYRRDPGFQLLEEEWLPYAIEKGHDYTFAIVMQGPRMRYYVDGRKIFDATDENGPHRHGHHGYRTWQSYFSSGLFRVSRIVD